MNSKKLQVSTHKKITMPHKKITMPQKNNQEAILNPINLSVS